MISLVVSRCQTYPFQNAGKERLAKYYIYLKECRWDTLVDLLLTN